MRNQRAVVEGDGGEGDAQQPQHRPHRLGEALTGVDGGRFGRRRVGGLGLGDGIEVERHGDGGDQRREDGTDAAPADVADQGVRGREGDGTGEAGEQRHQGDGLARAFAHVAGQDGEAGLVERAAHDDAEHRPKQVELPERRDPGEAGEKERREQRRGRVDVEAETPVDGAPDHRRDDGREQQGQGEGAAEFLLRPAELALPMAQKRREQIESAGPGQHLGGRQRPDDGLEFAALRHGAASAAHTAPLSAPRLAPGLIRIKAAQGPRRHNRAVRAGLRGVEIARESAKLGENTGRPLQTQRAKAARATGERHEQRI